MSTNAGATKVTDPVHDDVALWIRTKLGLLVVLGCGHAVVINTSPMPCT